MKKNIKYRKIFAKKLLKKVSKQQNKISFNDSKDKIIIYNCQD